MQSSCWIVFDSFFVSKHSFPFFPGLLALSTVAGVRVPYMWRTSVPRFRIALCCALLISTRVTSQPSATARRDSVPLFSNLGTLHHQITATPAAQRYFDQGLRLMYAFNHEEAINSFREGLRIDPRCAMCHWGIAIALGPNINASMDSTLEKEAFDETGAADALTRGLSESESSYIAAARQRYSPSAGANRARLDSAYAAAMRGVANRYANDPDAAALFAESMLDLSPWDNWTPAGEAKPGTQEIVATLERGIAYAPNHPGLCHFYIHTVEASLTPERALPCAERLAALMPGAGHLVHMPAHIYLRVGRYADATTANEHAAHTDEMFLADRQPRGGYPFYYAHNLDFLRAATMMEGRSAEAIKAAQDLVAKIPVQMALTSPSLQYFTTAYLGALARFGKWNEILAQPAPAAGLLYGRALWHYARGLALAGNGRFAEAAGETDSVAAAIAALPADFAIGFHSGKSLLGIAHHTLLGEIALRRGRAADAVPHLEEAVKLQDALRYDEPTPWYYPVRQSLGAALLAAGRASDAERVFTEDLRRNPNNGWALYGLAASLKAQGRDDSDAQRKFAAAWARSDVKLSSSRF
jgi:tetratricopeptide (TPR) repeat protein